MAEKENQVHKKFGIEFNNKIWSYFGKSERTAAEDQEMIQYAYASLLHWSLFEDHKIVNIQRGQYMIAKAHLYAGELDEALKHANLCLETTQSHLDEMQDFDVAYGFQILAAVHHHLGNSEESTQFLNKAQEATQEIEKKEDREYVEKDLAGDMSITFR